MKRIVTTMMAMIMMFTMFGSIYANAAKRDELYVYDIIVHDDDIHPIKQRLGSGGHTAVIDRVTLELDDGMDYPTINSEALTKAYAKYCGLDNLVLTSKLILVEDNSGHDMGYKFICIRKADEKLTCLTVWIDDEILRSDDYLTDICAYL